MTIGYSIQKIKRLSQTNMELVLAYEYDRALKRERVYQDQLDLLHVSDEDLLKNYRFPRNEIIALITELEPQLKRSTKRSHALPVSTQILVALRFYSSGTFQNVIGDTAGITQASVSNIVHKVTSILAEKARIEIKMPTDMVEIQQYKQKFHILSGFPRVIGAIDGSHIPIKAPAQDEDIYVNRKRYHSLNIQVVSDADRKIISYNVNYPGSTHDAFIWSNCALRTRFLNGEFRDGMLLGDSGYPLESFLMTPFANPSTPSEQCFNQSHTATRVIVEQTFGVLKSRFRCLHKSGGNLQYDPAKCAKITIACMLLHNRCIQRNIPNPIDELEVEPVELHYDHEEGDAVRGQARDVRSAIVNNFFS